MRLDEIGPSASDTGPTDSTRRPRGAPSEASTPILPRRPAPKVKSSPVTATAAPKRSTSHSITKASALTAAIARSNLNTSIASAPAAANRRSR